jgi:predicted kinase
MSGMLIVMSGLPATGKSALADALAPAVDGIVLSVDPIESALLMSGIDAGQPTGLAAYAVAAAIAEINLRLERTVIIDAVNSVGEAKNWWIELARREDVRLLVVETVCSDEAVHRRRLAERRRTYAIGEPSWETVTLRRDEWVAWPFAPLTVDAVDPLADNLARIVAAVAASRMPPDSKTPEETSGP